MSEDEAGTVLGSGPLAGQVAIVTGCGNRDGMGRAIALALSEAGAAVAVTDVSRSSPAADSDWRGIDSLAAEIEAAGRRALPVVCDVTSETQVDAMVATVADELGRVDVLVNNAAAPHGADRDWSWNVGRDAFDKVLAVNCTGTFLCSTAVVRHLLDRGAPGRVINIGSSAGRQGMPQRAAYSASKFAVIGLTQSLAQELATSGITVNAVCPGPTSTPRQRSTASRLESGDEQPNERFKVTTTPVGRLGAPADVSRMVVFLADPAADFITGQSFNVDGGFVMS